MILFGGGRTTGNYNRLSDALERAIAFIDDRFGSCPHDMFGWEPVDGCESHCDNSDTPAGCWVHYFADDAAHQITEGGDK